MLEQRCKAFAAQFEAVPRSHSQVSFVVFHMQSGVVTLSDKKQLYVVPPGVQLFDAFRSRMNPSDDQV